MQRSKINATSRKCLPTVQKGRSSLENSDSEKIKIVLIRKLRIRIGKDKKTRGGRKKMDIRKHLLVFTEILTLVLLSYSLIVIISGVWQYFIHCLILCCLLFGAVYYFRIERAPNTSTELILGKEWGAYNDYKPCQLYRHDNVIKVIGHRACGLDAPENSISALNRMHSRGISMVEFDVALTFDDVPVVFHDSNLYRMTQKNKDVSAVPLSEIKQLNISVKHTFGKMFQDEKIPTLHEFVSACLDKNIRMIIDLKSGEKKMIKIINDLFKEYPELYHMAIASSFDPFLIYKIRKNDPKIVSSLCWRPYYHSHEDFSGEKGPSNPRSMNLFVSIFQRFLNVIHKWFLWNIGYYIVGVSVILLAKDSITREEIRYWNRRGIRLIAWTVNLPSEKEYFENNLKITYLTDTAINKC